MSFPHLALQLRDSFGKLSLSGFWQLRVEALTEAPDPVLPVFTLDRGGHLSAPSRLHTTALLY